MNVAWLYGLAPLTLPAYVAIAAAMVQTTIVAVTVYLHRDAAHRSIDLHPALRHFFRCWIWMTSGMLTCEWVAVHRKHHVYADRPRDPHSPVQAGLRRILLEGAEFYARESRNPNTQKCYGKGTPADWIERRVYSRHRNAGIVIFVLLELALFGVPGIIMISVQMLAMPVLAAGVINGIGHSIGYRNYEVDNASTNIVPWGVVVGGEELHNNHHAFPSSARFSLRPWEFDSGWLCIVLLRALGLAKVRRVAPKPCVIATGGGGVRRNAEPDAVHAVIYNRMHVLRAYALQVVAPVLDYELRGEPRRAVARAFRKLITRSPVLLDAAAQRRLHELLETYPVLRTVHDCQEQLRQLWDTANAGNHDVAGMFKNWCARAEASGIQALANFASAISHLSYARRQRSLRTQGHAVCADVQP